MKTTSSPILLTTALAAIAALAMTIPAQAAKPAHKKVHHSTTIKPHKAEPVHYDTTMVMNFPLLRKHQPYNTRIKSLPAHVQHRWY